MQAINASSEKKHFKQNFGLSFFDLSLGEPKVKLWINLKG
jgi:hypothetical protein